MHYVRCYLSGAQIARTVKPKSVHLYITIGYDYP